ncbi:MAG: diaminopimelate decarboxylase [Clostridiales bacterium]|nr:diaminopimelate decarboxylase [Clostridiales bacterium]MDD7387721.1 diaminopimelate decarboxylase [Bacillota bacterium]MDY6040676.1 diaminopimelate decarboxylase [Candidatus Faecousia sp.]
MDKKPFLTLAKAREIIDQIPTPFHIYDEAGIRANARALKQAFSWNPGYREYFAVKATPNPYLIQILKEEGCGCDCSSYTELLLAEAVGVTGHDIMFSSNVTPVKDMRKAYEMGAYINLDDATHVDFLDRVTDHHIPETVCLRYNPGGSFTLGNAIMDMPQDAKYGMTEAQMISSVSRLMELGAKHFGIHAFLASNTTSNEYYPELAAILFRLAVRVHKATGCHISFINLSGGVGVDYRPEEPRCDIGLIGEGVRKRYEQILTPEGMDDIAIFTELGRYMLAPYGHLVSTVLHFKHIYREYVGLDACAADLMRPAMYGAYHHITVLGKENAPLDHVYDVTGGLCENNDKFAIQRSLPEIQTGDIVVIHDTGAHGHSMGYNYNGKLRSAEVLLHPDGTFRLIRRAETPADYFATLDISGLHFGK